MEFIPPDIFSAAVELAPTHRATLNQQKQKAAIHKLRKCSWITPETFGCASNTTVTFVGVILLVFFCRCFLHRWRRYKGIYPFASCCVSRCVAPYRRVAHRIDKVWKRQKRRMKKRFFRLWLLYIILHYLVRRKVARVWTKCKDKGAYYFECMKIAYIKAALFIYRFSSFMRVSAMVIFLHLFMSGDVELNPGPQDNLTIDDLSEVLDEIWDARSKWKLIGLHLHFKMTDLEPIEMTKKGAIDECFIEMLTLWLRRADPPPTWSALVAALKRRMIGFQDLAKQVESKFLQSSTTGSDSAKGATGDYTEEFKSRYKAKTYASCDDIQWPPPVDDKHKVFRLEIVEAKRKIRRTAGVESDWARCKTIDNKVDEVVRQRVPIELKDIFTKIEGQPKVLLEGGPGSGKSTLSFHIRQEWANGRLFQEYKLVVLIRLRDFIVQNAKSVADLLQNIVGEVAEEIVACKGESVLFIFDGWDELTKEKPGHSVILDLIKGNELWKSSIITTSRPTSSANIHEHVSVRAEILGFSKSELRSYFTFCLKDDPKDVNDLLKRIEDNPIIEGICYLPLNASILVHLFICGDGELPDTQYGIFHDLVCNCIYRYLKKTQKGATDIPKVKSLSKLPQAVKNHFQQLCELAYNGVMNDEVIFHIEQSGFVTLDLLQKVESFDRYGGMSYSYNFLHLSIQELLAAVHIATKLGNNDQAEKFKEMYDNPRFSAVFQFYAAITKLETPGMNDVVVQVAKRFAVNPDDECAAFLSLLHCLYEAQDSSLCQLVVDQLESKLDLGGTMLNLAECFSLQYFLKHLENFEIDLKGCSVDGDKCKALFKPDQAYPIKSLGLKHNFLRDEGAHILSEALKNMKNLQHLDLRYTKIEDKGIVHILSAVKTMTTLQSLNIGNNDSFKDKGVEAILEAMEKVPNLQHFKLGLKGIGSEAALAVLTGMKTMATVPRMDLRDNFRDDDEYTAFSEVLKTISNLQYLELQCYAFGDEKVVALSEGLKGLTKLQHLDLGGNSIQDKGVMALSEALIGMTNLQYLDLGGNSIQDKGVMALSEALIGMTNLQYLNLGGNSIQDKGVMALSEALIGMTNLQYLDLRKNYIKAKGGVALSEALRGMINLQYLDLQYNNIGEEGGVALSKALREMTNLQHLDLQDNNIGEEGGVALSKALRGMTNLQHLDLQGNDNIGEEGGVAICEALRGMTNLQYLNLWGTSIGTKAAVALSVAMETMTNLQHLDLGYNKIDDVGAVAISAPLKKMPNLQKLILDFNEFGDTGAEDLAEAMKTMINLQVLRFGGWGNSVSYEGAMTILAVIRTMSNLKTLDFCNLPLGDDGALAVLDAVKVMPSLQEFFVHDYKHGSIGEAGEKAIEEAEELIKTRKSKS